MRTGTIGRWLGAAVVAAAVATPVQAQLTPRADPADVASVDAIITAVYEVISGGAGEQRNWARFLSLFAPDARLVPSGSSGGFNNYNVWTPREYMQQVGPQLTQGGFFEREIHRVTEQFGHVVHLFSTYESRRNADDPEPFTRGINSFQLLHDGNRWWVLSIYWTSERSDLPIPAKYLPSM